MSWFLGASGGGSGTVGGTGTAGQVTYFSDTSTIAGNASFLFDSTNIALRIGTTGILASTNETFSSRFNAASGNSGQSSAAGVFLYRNHTDTAFTSFQRGILSGFSRTITTNTTDTNDSASLCTYMSFSATGSTYTHSGNIAQVTLNAPTLAAGSLALSFYSGIRIEPSSVNTGTRRAGIYVGAQTGTSNYARWADSTSYSGAWNFYCASTDRNHFAGYTYIGGTAAHTLNTEKISVQDSLTGSANNSAAGCFLMTGTGNTAFSGSGNLAGLQGVVQRTITSGTTDTQGRIYGVIGQVGVTCTGVTYTNASTNGVGYFSTTGFIAHGGTMAVTHFAGFNMSANSIVTGTNKYGVRIQALSGANTSNYAFYCDNVSGATNNYSLYTGTGAASLGDYLELRGNHDPGAPTDAVRISGKVSTDAGTPNTLHLRTEQAVEATATFTQSHRLRVWINNVEYYIPLDNV